MTQELLSLQGLSKSFPGVRSLHRVSFRVCAGEVLSLMGENGAGKSTLIKILAGVYQPDEGRILFDGQDLSIESPGRAQELGISVIFQELSLLDNLSIAENIFLGREKRRLGFVYNRTATHEAARRLLQEVGLSLDPETIVGQLSLSQKQMVEVAKALSFKARLIIMDEPTSSLTEHETEQLFRIIAKLKERGVAIIFVSHKMDEMKHISDVVHVLRDGEYVGCLNNDEITEDRIIQMMVGRNIGDVFHREQNPVGSMALEVRNLNTRYLKNINFTLRHGEIVGFAGLVGAGRSEVMRALFGIDPKQSGDIWIDQERVSISSPAAAIAKGMAYVSEDRKGEGLILGMNVRQNVTLSSLKTVSRLGIIRYGAESRASDRYIESLHIKTPSGEQSVVNLSGGNQQKVVLSKWLSTLPKVLIVDEPTRGIDVAAKKEIHAVLNQLAKSGVAIILISSELPEILGMSDRVMVMHEGRIKGELSREEASGERIMQMAYRPLPTKFQHSTTSVDKEEAYGS